MSIKLAVTLGAAFCAAAVVGGAFGAHALEARLTPERLALWRTAAQYLMYSGLGAIACGVVGAVANLDRGPGALAMITGGLIFGGTVAVLALGGPRWLGAVTPIGGALMILGFVQLAWTSSRSL